MNKAFLLSLLLILPALGCSEFFHSPDDRRLAQGFTPCGDFLAPWGQTNHCNPNQYCADVTFSTCTLGCLSEFNCTRNQVCVKDWGEDVGSCVQVEAD